MVRLLSKKARRRTLRAVYELLQKGIQKHELDTFETLVQEVRSGNWLVFCVFDKRKPVAVRVNEISSLAETGIAVSLFSVVEKGRERRGLFRQLIAAANKKLREMNTGFFGVMAEMDTSDYGISKESRREVFRRVGYKKIGLRFRYVLPPLDDGAEPNPTMIPVFLPQPGITSLPARRFARAIRIYWSWVDSLKDPKGRQMREQTISRLRRQNRILLIPL